jgi:hypothetical protein
VLINILGHDHVVLEVANILHVDVELGEEHDNNVGDYPKLVVWTNRVQFFDLLWDHDTSCAGVDHEQNSCQDLELPWELLDFFVTCVATSSNHVFGSSEAEYVHYHQQVDDPG